MAKPTVENFLRRDPATRQIYLVDRSKPGEELSVAGMDDDNYPARERLLLAVLATIVQTVYDAGRADMKQQVEPRYNELLKKAHEFEQLAIRLGPID
jgi:hypothetical protein